MPSKKEDDDREYSDTIIDISGYDWLKFPFWEKALELEDDFPAFLLWLNDENYELAAMVAIHQEEFEVVKKRIIKEIETAAGLPPSEPKAKGKEKVQSRDFLSLNRTIAHTNIPLPRVFVTSGRSVSTKSQAEKK